MLSNLETIACFRCFYKHKIELCLFLSVDIITNNINNSIFSVRPFLEKDRLNGENFITWERTLRLLLKSEGKEDVLENPLPVVTNESSDADKRRAKQANDRSTPITCFMVAAMEPDLQRRFETKDAYTIMQELKAMFQKQARIERYEINKEILECKMENGESVRQHAFKMMGLFESMERLGFPYSQQLATDIILHSLLDSFNQFRMTFNMNESEKTLTQLHGMLVNAERNIPKEPKKEVLMVQKGKGFKKKGAGKKNKGKQVVKNSEKPKQTAKPKVAAESKCFYCEKIGHWKRNCPKYLEDKKSGASTSGIYVIEVNLTSTSLWVFDTGCGSHIVNDVQGLKRSRKLAKGEVELRVGNGARVAALAVGSYSLHLPSGLILELNNCYFVPSITKNIISVSVLDNEGFCFEIKNKCCSISYNNMFYASAKLINGLYVLDRTVQVYNINSKKQKSNDLNPTYLWHCRMGHINQKRIQKLQKDGILTSFDYESFDVCESCLLGKMTKSPFTGKGERANDLLALIHTDVCGPMSSKARGGFSYFITFTDDLSRYGYIYLMKHKSESFEKFKEFQNKVQNQLGKTIKAL